MKQRALAKVSVLAPSPFGAASFRVSRSGPWGWIDVLAKHLEPCLASNRRFVHRLTQSMVQFYHSAGTYPRPRRRGCRRGETCPAACLSFSLPKYGKSSSISGITIRITVSGAACCFGGNLSLHLAPSSIPEAKLRVEVTVFGGLQSGDLWHCPDI
jgi:hypothetical protein